MCLFNKCESSSIRSKQLLSLLKLDHLQSKERGNIEAICSKYTDIFNLPGDKLTSTNICDHTIRIKENSGPVYVKPYRAPKSLKPEMHRQIKRMIDDDIIEETRSEWSSPILLVPKKGESRDKKE